MTEILAARAIVEKDGVRSTRSFGEIPPLPSEEHERWNAELVEHLKILADESRRNVTITVRIEGAAADGPICIEPSMLATRETITAVLKAINITKT